MNVPKKVREAVYDRDGHTCVRCGGSGPLTLQHRKARAMGGTKKRDSAAMPNLLTLCGSGTTGCHGWAEHNPVAARALGLAVSSWDDPAAVPVRYERTGELFQLHAEGHLELVTA